MIKLLGRGNTRDLVIIQEDINKNILKVEKKTLEALLDTKLEEQYKYLLYIRLLVPIHKLVICFVVSIGI